jgi:hypothetical protein
VVRAVDGIVGTENLVSLAASLLLGSPCLVAE